MASAIMADLRDRGSAVDLNFRFGAVAAGVDPAAAVIELPNAVVAGPPMARVDSNVSRSPCRDGLTLWRRGEELWGAAVRRVAPDGFETVAREVYRAVLAATGDLHLHRAWNFLPHINGHGRHMENYQAFCVGRGVALDDAFGSSADRRLPAATGVGTPGDRLVVMFVAGTATPRHLENPSQTPAYRYPDRYGPRPPSFARGTLTARPEGRRLYVSGTGAIRDSESLHAGDVEAQCRVVLENVGLVAGAAGLPGLDRNSPGRRAFRVYLRHPSDWPQVEALLRAELLRPEDALQAVQADICRDELLMEIEACVDLPGPQVSAQ